MKIGKNVEYVAEELENGKWVRVLKHKTFEEANDWALDYSFQYNVRVRIIRKKTDVIVIDTYDCGKILEKESGA